MILKPKNREDWLKMRAEVGIGGSDAGSVMGLNQYKSNVDLWLEKTDSAHSTSNDISQKPAVKFGKLAEEHLRELFKLDFPQYVVNYHEFYMYCNDEKPWQFATLDGELYDTLTGQRGILEIKTTTIMNSMQWDEWENRIPDTYYAQILHQLSATGWDFAILKAYIRYTKGDELRATTRHYLIKRESVIDEIKCLTDEEEKFMNFVRTGQRPPLHLPQV